MQLFPRETERAPPSSLPTGLPTSVSDSLTEPTGPTAGTGDGGTTDGADNTSDPTSPPTSPPVTSVNTTTLETTTSEKTSTTTSTIPKTTSNPPPTSKDTTSSSDTSSAPLTPPPVAFNPSTTSAPTFNVTTPSSVTANFTTIVTTSGGQTFTFTSQLPTSLVTADSSSHDSDTHRTTVIAGTTTVLFVFVLSVLVAIFAYRRHKLRKTLAISSTRKEGRGLLDGEDFDDDIPPQMRSINSQRHSLARSTSPSPSLLKSRVAKTGSIFREEVWPPPGFDDPISKNSSQVDLGRIVDDVMGSSTDTQHERDLTNATTTSTISASTASSNPNPFLASENPQPSTSPLVYNDPFGASGSQASFYSSNSYLPPGASPPIQPGLPSSSTLSLSPPPSSPSPVFRQSPPEMSMPYMPASGSAASNRSVSGPSSGVSNSTPLSPARPSSISNQPKKSSPLARALSDRNKMLLPGGPAPPAPSIGPFH